MIRPISGTFIEIEHPNRAERVLTHDALSAFTAASWQHKVRETHTLGMDTLVLLSTALRSKAYFPLDGFPFAPHLACPDPMDAILSAADATGQQVYIGVGYYGTTDSVANTTDPAVIATALRAMNRLFSLYGAHASFVGWYIADEWCLWERFDERFISYINVVCREAKQLCATHRVIVAPFGTHCLRADDAFAAQLERIEADAIAYQDEIGVRKMTLGALSSRFEALANVHAKAGRAALWADTEIFTFADEVYRSALLPASFDRVKAQMKAVSPYVDKIIAYTVQGLMEPSDSAAPLADQAAHTLYRDYQAWRQSGI